MLKIINFIREHNNWEELLSSPPYSLSIKRKDTLILFKYSQFDSDFSLEIVKEARGLILEDKTWNVVCYPFKKFFNYGEAYADEIDWKSAEVTSKEDGTLIKVYYYNGKWRVGTNSTIDAEDATLNSPYYKNFKELFDVAADNCKFDFDKLNPNYTYLMELCSCYNTIVVPYEQTKLFHIGTRNNITYKEIEVDIGVTKPQRYELYSLEDCIKMAETFDFKQEGFVVKDKNYNRIKIKSLDYLKAHRLSNNSNINIEHAIDMIRTNEIEEFLSYFPFYTDFILDTKAKIKKLVSIVNDEIKKAHNVRNLASTKKEFAIIANDSIYPFIWYNVYTNPEYTAITFINNLTSKQLAKYISNI